jgi:Flp pilus assembly protein CpaB
MDELFPKGEDVLRSVLRTIDKDEALLAGKVTAPGEDAGVGARLAAGMRAFAVRVDVTSGVSGFLRPGDRVDFYWTGSPPGGGGEITKLIDTNVRLIAVDQSADEDISDAAIARTVTVEATPQQVASLAQAQQSGRLWLSLVGVDDATDRVRSPGGPARAPGHRDGGAADRRTAAGLHGADAPRRGHRRSPDRVHELNIATNALTAPLHVGCGVRSSTLQMAVCCHLSTAAPP